MVMDDEEPLTLLLADLTNFGHEKSLPASSVLDALDALESRGFLLCLWWPEEHQPHRLRPPTASERLAGRSMYHSPGEAASASDPHRGLWYRATDAGRDYWARYVDGATEIARWQLRYSPESGTLEIVARDALEIEDALNSWRSSNPGLDVARDAAAVPHTVDFTARDGTKIQNGIQVRFRVR